MISSHYEDVQRKHTHIEKRLQSVDECFSKVLYKCHKCGTSFKQKSSLAKHMLFHSSDQPFNCGDCNIKFVGKCVARKYSVEYSSERENKLQLNDFADESRFHINDDFLVEYTKNIPENILKKKSNEHTSIEALEKTNVCYICDKTCKNRWRLKQHLLFHAKERPHECQLCNKRFVLKGDLTKHIRIHTGEQPYECNTCGKRFSQKGSLDNHKLIHTGERPHKCSECGKTFIQKNHLDMHVLSHTDSKPYKCPICNKCFSIKRSLSRHLLIHRGERPYNCDKCGRSFTLKGKLTRHLLTHTGDRQFLCNICGKTFSQNSNLVQHMTTHQCAIECPFICDLCGRLFSQKCLLRKHMSLHKELQSYDFSEFKMMHDAERQGIGQQKECTSKDVKGDTQCRYEKVLVVSEEFISNVQNTLTEPDCSVVQNVDNSIVPGVTHFLVEQCYISIDFESGPEMNKPHEFVKYDIEYSDVLISSNTISQEVHVTEVDFFEMDNFQPFSQCHFSPTVVKHNFTQCYSHTEENITAESDLVKQGCFVLRDNTPVACKSANIMSDKGTLEENSSPLLIKDFSTTLSHASDITSDDRIFEGDCTQLYNKDNGDKMQSVISNDSIASDDKIFDVDNSRLDDNTFSTNTQSEFLDRHEMNRFKTSNDGNNIKCDENKLSVKKTHFTCPLCEKAFPTQVALRHHISTHDNDLPIYKCEECGRVFSVKGRLLRHMLVHSGERPHKCTECRRAFAQKANLIKHMFIHTGVKPHKCEDCGKLFAQKNDLKKHTFVHSQIRSHECSECFKKFILKSKLNRHMEIHSPSRKYICEECGKVFSQEDTLKQHQLIHSVELSHKCNECGKIFSSKGNLSKHSLLHISSKRFVCPHCGKMFSQKGNLRKHLLIHAGERPFTCRECGKSFVLKANLVQHLKMHTSTSCLKNSVKANEKYEYPEIHL